MVSPVPRASVESPGMGGSPAGILPSEEEQAMGLCWAFQAAQAACMRRLAVVPGDC